MNRERSSSPAIVAAFLEMYLRDQDAGVVRSLEEYQARFPRFEEVVAAEYRRVTQSTASAQDGEDSNASERDAETDAAVRRIRREVLEEESSAQRSAPARVGPYTVVHRLGRGGQGTVYAAVDSRLDRQVAVKVLSGLGSTSPDVLQRFQREARIVSVLDHPSICPIFDADLEGATPYVAMRHVDGEPLAEVLRSRPKLVAPPVLPVLPTNVEELRSVLRFFAEIARALDYAHERGIVHRDIKPANVMVQPDGTPVILDFGLASASLGGLDTLTRSGDLLGTPAYMSPEQIRGQGGAVDGRTDVYSLAVTLHECLTGKRLFSAPSREALFRKILLQTPASVRRDNPLLPVDLQVVLATALEKEPGGRYDSAEQFAEDLRAVEESRPIVARPATALTRLTRWGRREPAKALLTGSLCLAAAVILGLGGYLFSQRRVHEELVRQASLEATRQRVEAHLEQGFADMEERAFSLAERGFYAALGLEAATVEAGVGLALVDLARDGPTRAMERLEEFPRFSGTRLFLRLRSLVLHQLNRSREAVALEESLGVPHEPFELFLMGVERMEAWPGHGPVPTEALADLTRATLVSEQPRALFHLARMRAAELCEDWGALESSAEALAHHWPESAVAWARIGTRYQNLDPERARAALERSVELRPTWLAWTSLSLLELKNQNWDEALLYLDRALHLEPDNAIGYHNRGWVLHQSGRAEEAEEALRKSLDVNPDYGDAHAKLAVVLTSLRQFEEAESAAERAIELEPDREDNYVVAGYASMSRGEWKHAAQFFEGALLRNPTNFSALSGKGVALANQGMLEEALDPFRACVDLRPDVHGVHTNLATALRSRGDHKELRDELRRWCSVDPEDPRGHANLAAFHTEESTPADLVDWDEAFEAVERALELDPSPGGAVLFTYAQILAADGAWEEAWRYSQQARESTTDPALVPRIQAFEASLPEPR